ncbi:hypothetical protein [Amycolatopsis sp. NPDC051372]|uniref:hypothetical protein n=1 Tax=Amycolatopsis sp. NPDC051372 TaxID=3155669 RepID=UPI003442A4EE
MAAVVEVAWFHVDVNHVVQGLVIVRRVIGVWRRSVGSCALALQEVVALRH